MFHLATAAPRPLPPPLPLAGRLAIVGFFTFAGLITAVGAANALRKGVFSGRRGRSWTRLENPGGFWFNVVLSFIMAAGFLGVAAYAWFSEMRIH